MVSSSRVSSCSKRSISGGLEGSDLGDGEDEDEDEGEGEGKGDVDADPLASLSLEFIVNEVCRADVKKGSVKIFKEYFPSIFITNLACKVSIPWLSVAFKKFGVIRDIYIPRRASNLAGRKYAFVRFEKEDEVAAASRGMDGVRVRSSSLRVSPAKPTRSDVNGPSPVCLCSPVLQPWCSKEEVLASGPVLAQPSVISGTQLSDQILLSQYGNNHLLSGPVLPCSVKISPLARKKVPWSAVKAKSVSGSGKVSCTSVFVGNIPPMMSYKKLRTWFLGFGSVVDVFVSQRRSRVDGSAFAFVRFRDQSDARRACAEVDGSLVEGFLIVANLARFARSNPRSQSKVADNSYAVLPRPKKGVSGHRLQSSSGKRLYVEPVDYAGFRAKAWANTSVTFLSEAGFRGWPCSKPGSDSHVGEFTSCGCGKNGKTGASVFGCLDPIADGLCAHGVNVGLMLAGTSSISTSSVSNWVRFL